MREATIVDQLIESDHQRFQFGKVRQIESECGLVTQMLDRFTKLVSNPS